MMAVEIPTVGVVPQCDAPLARCSTIETPRISQEGSLNWRTIRDAFAPQTLTSFDAGNHRWSAVQTLASYNRSGFHVLFIDRTDRYVPDATFMEDKEGEKLMKVLAFTGQYQQGLDNTHAIHIGYNWSPASFGEKGLQSVPTKHHPQCWNEEADLPYVSIEDIKSDVQPALLGTPYHREFGPQSVGFWKQ